MARLLFTIHRFGADIVGGAERLARDYAGLLAARGHIVEVATTCARDYMTWRNEFPPGTTKESLDGPIEPSKITVHRFRVPKPRRLTWFRFLSRLAFRRPHDRKLVLHWMRAQGPDSPELEKWISQRSREFDAACLFNYLYFTTWQAIPHLADRAILIPFAHDEPPLGLGAYRSVFSAPAVIGTSSDTEESLLRERFDPILPSRLVRLGSGVNHPNQAEADIGAFARVIKAFSKVGLASDLSACIEEGEFVLCLGRMSPAKGTDRAIAAWETAASVDESLPPLLLTGPLEAGYRPISRSERVLIVPEALDESLAASLRSLAVATLHPSPHESLNLAALASLAAGTPLLVFPDSRATVEIVNRSGAGEVVDPATGTWPAKLREALARLRDPDLASRARRFIEERHRWPDVADRLEMAVELAAQHAKDSAQNLARYLPA